MSLTTLTAIPRIGTGFDVHKFANAPADGKEVMIKLCGIDVPHSQAILAHSDGDVALHALVDALLGAVALGDIGVHFPPTDMRWKDADSAQFVRHAIKLVKQEQAELVNIDLTIICERPKVKPHMEAMRSNLALLCNLPISRVSVKATTTEKLGFTGRKEGIAVQAACLVLQTI